MYICIHIFALLSQAERKGKICAYALFVCIYAYIYSHRSLRPKGRVRSVRMCRLCVYMHTYIRIVIPGRKEGKDLLLWCAYVLFVCIYAYIRSHRYPKLKERARYAFVMLFVCVEISMHIHTP